MEDEKRLGGEVGSGPLDGARENLAAVEMAKCDSGPFEGSKDPESLLEIEDLSVTFETPEGHFEAIREVSLAVRPGEIVGVVGESGSGKTTAMMGALSQLPKSTKVRGKVLFRGQNMLEMRRRERRRLLGKEIGIVFQEPSATLDPLFTIGKQLEEVLTEHASFKNQVVLAARKVELLKSAGVTDAEQRLRQYPSELSGGLCQRVSLAMAFAHRPRLIVADEPTTALDVTVQAQILRLLVNLVRKAGSGLVLISHDLGVIANVADRVAVMYGGMVVEKASVRTIFEKPQHPYTERLLACVPRFGVEQSRLGSIEGVVPSRYDRMVGCRFAPRCHMRIEECLMALPELRRVEPLHEVRCIRAGDGEGGKGAQDVAGG